MTIVLTIVNSNAEETGISSVDCYRSVESVHDCRPKAQLVINSADITKLQRCDLTKIKMGNGPRSPFGLEE